MWEMKKKHAARVSFSKSLEIIGLLFGYSPKYNNAKLFHLHFSFLQKYTIKYWIWTIKFGQI